MPSARAPRAPPCSSTSPPGRARPPASSAPGSGTGGSHKGIARGPSALQPGIPMRAGPRDSPATLDRPRSLGAFCGRQQRLRAHGGVLPAASGSCSIPARPTAPTMPPGQQKLAGGHRLQTTFPVPIQQPAGRWDLSMPSPVPLEAPQAFHEEASPPTPQASLKPSFRTTRFPAHPAGREGDRVGIPGRGQGFRVPRDPGLLEGIVRNPCFLSL